MKRILVIGDAMVDYRRCGRSDRMSPEDPGCHVVTDIETKIELGGAANVAYWLAAQPDLQVTLVCHWAADEAGVDLMNLCRGSGIDLSELCLRPCGSGRTTRKERICVNHPSSIRFQQLVRCDEDTDSKLNEFERKGIENRLDRDPFDLIVVADYQKGMFTGMEGTFIRCWLGAEGPIIVNSKRPVDWAYLPLSALIFNRSEGNTSWPGLTLRKVVKQEYVRAQRLIMTKGSEGVACNLWEEGDSIEGTIWSTPSLADHVLDVTGAGDAFTAGFAAQFLRRPQMAGHASLTDSEVKACIHEGQRWAAHCCRQIGCGTPLVSSGLAVHD